MITFTRIAELSLTNCIIFASFQQDLTMTQRQTRTTTTKLVAYISDVSFEIPEDFKVDNDSTVNEVYDI